MKRTDVPPVPPAIWTTEAIRHQSGLWRSSWTPPGARLEVRDGCTLSCTADEATLLDHSAELEDPREVVAHTRQVARELGARSLRVTVAPGRLGELDDDALRRWRIETVLVSDIVAADLRTLDTSVLAPSGSVGTIEVVDAASLSLFDEVSHQVWGFRSPILEEIESGASEASRLPSGLFVGTDAGVPAGAAGYLQAGPVARLFGAAVAARSRGRGVYRGLIAARVEHCLARGATLALVHAEPTSSPILQHLGFKVHGQRRLLRMEL